MAQAWGKSQVVVLAEAAVAVGAPDELWLVKQTCAAYSKRLRRRGRQTRTEDMLGFGLEESVSAVAIAAVGAAQAAVVFLASQAAAAARDESSGLVKAWVSGLFHRLRRGGGQDGAQLPSDHTPLSPASLKQVREVVYRQARDLGATAEQAALMADAIVGRLVAGEAAAGEEAAGEAAAR